MKKKKVKRAAKAAKKTQVPLAGTQANDVLNESVSSSVYTYYTERTDNSTEQGGQPHEETGKANDVQVLAELEQTETQPASISLED